MIQISHGDVASNEIYYQSKNTCCYQKYRKLYIKKLKEKDKDDEKTCAERWFKINSFINSFIQLIIHHIKQTKTETPGRIF